jgi:hypothetical protein
MPRLSTVAEFVSLCYIILLAILLEVEDRREMAKTNAEVAELMKKTSEICSSTETQKANHITKSPCFFDDSGCPPPYQILQPCCWIPGNCEPDQTTLEIDAGIAALFELRDGSSTCVASTKNPASVWASLTTTEKSDESTLTSIKRYSLETGSLKNRDGTE